eukprot:3753552-Rhodomonas_salina.1
MVLTIGLHKTGGTRRSLWSSKRGLFPGLELGQWGMGVGRFEMLSKHLDFSLGRGEDGDKWRE